MSESQALLTSDNGRGSMNFSRLKGSRSRSVARAVGAGVSGILGIQSPARNGEKGNFTSSIGVVLSMIGTTVGTGNIWRFPRIMATNAEEGGALVFILVWLLFLLIWSIPLNLVQYGVGRYTKVCTVESFARLIGPSYRWLGGFIVGTNLLIGAFYSVLLGYCGYYAFFFMFTSLPDSLETAESHFDFLINSHWPVLFHILFTVLASLALSRGVSTIEPVNRVIVPILLVIVLFTLYWSMYLPYAGMGLIHMFTPSWKSFGNTQIWRDALTQNAWDTAAGGGLFLTYATYMTRYQGAVKMGMTIPVINNFISLISGMTVFCNVFSFEYLKGSSIEVIVDVLKTNGPFNTGITFVQMPLLYGSINGGRILAVLFFIGVTLAGLSSLISVLEQSVHVLEDFGIKRTVSAAFICVLSASIGLASALSNDVFVNQDAVWAQSLIVCGCFFMFLVIRYGVLKFRRDLYNNFGIGDWSLPIFWVFLITIVCPIEGIGTILWWIIDEMVNKSDPYGSAWWEFTPTSLINIITQWTVLLCIVIGFNWWMKPIILPVSKLRATTRSSRLRKLLDFVFVNDTMPHREQTIRRTAPAILSEDTSSSEGSVIFTKESSMTCDTKEIPGDSASDSGVENSKLNED